MSKEPLLPEEIQILKMMSELIEEERYYELFNVSSMATQDEIQRGYYAISKKWHPDRFFRRDVDDYEELITDLFMGITAAFQTLNNPADRLTYDRTHAIEEKLEAKSIPQRYSHRKGRRRRNRENNRSTSVEKTIVKTLKEERREKVLSELNSSLDEKKHQAAKLFDEGLQHFENNAVIKAAASMHLACKLAPKNEAFRTKYKEVRILARQAKGMEIYLLAENAENFQNFSHALELYRKAVEYDVDESQAYARLAYLLEKLEPDPRETLRLLRIAVQKSPENADFHCRLGESYASQELTLNARREFTAALKIDKNLTRAKTGISNL